ncbi:sporulation protein YqfC [Paenibacillus selenitireducens]|uniref:Sporulation protein YqfC n=1 Tax=Paenibacillus selenitireducens TaxID=1324314 RepID=A0A1T2XEV1_9BACL|nr:sporulation protein YqfC [Paenibacillus selenitireducens]OPA78409.1 sporulation protein YqfC [Paenibacillus selenitireducens]
MRRFARKIRKMTTEMLDLPQDVVFDLPRVTMMGDVQVHIENHRGVRHFSDDRLRLSVSTGEIELTGSDLIIRAIWPDEVIVEGKITGIQYMRTGESR